MAVYATINGGVVENTILADAEFAAQIAGDFEHVINIDALDPRPGIGWLYDSGTETFTDPNYVPEE